MGGWKQQGSLNEKFLPNMKIEYIKIEDQHSMLNNFEWSSDKPLNIFIGENGSGKTTILKSLALIFKALYDIHVIKPRSHNFPDFNFELRYTVIIPNIEDDFTFETNYVGVTLKSVNSSKNFFEIITDNGKYSTEDIVNLFGYKSLLPSNIVAYYAGWDDKIKAIFSEVEDIYKSNMLEDVNLKIEAGYSVVDELPLIYIEKINFQILFAVLFAFEYNEQLDIYLREKFQITAQQVNPINIILKRPDENFYTTDFETFWGAKGELRKFLDVLKAYNEDSFVYNAITQTLTLSYNLDAWIRIREFYGTEKRLYCLIHLLNSSGFLAGIQTFFNKSDKTISNFHLSEGEQQLITLLGLREILLEQNSLILLDEPDTFLHPVWQHTFVGDLIENMDYPKGGEFLPFHNEPNIFITTHSLNLLNNADRQFSKVSIIRDGKEIKIPVKFYGKKISHINYNLMNVSERPLAIQNKINNLFEFLEIENLNESQKLYDELMADLGAEDEDLLRAKIELDYLKSLEDGKSFQN